MTLNYIPLPHPVPLRQQAWPEGTIPEVTIRCITYNHRKYITQSIESFLCQETTFPVQILIHDDASTDGTSQIIREYQQRHPKIIHAIFQTENQYSKGNMPGRILRRMGLLRGEFIAICEGDDYWTHPRKLQTQFEQLKANPDAVMAAHDVDIIDSSGNLLTEDSTRQQKPDNCERYFTGLDVIHGKRIYSASLLHKNIDIHTNQKKPRSIVNGDRYLFSMLAAHGGLVLSSLKMAAYRVHSGGVWSGADHTTRTWNKIKSRLAITQDIPPEYCHAACRNLADECLPFALSLLKRLNITESLKCFGILFLSWAYCFRSMKSPPSHWMNMAKCQLYIALSPLRIIVNHVMLTLKNNNRV